MKKLKVLSSAILAGATVVALASCGGSDGDLSKTIVFYNSAGSTISTNIQTVIDEFQAKHEGWTIEVSKQSNYDATLAQIVYDIQSNDQPSLAFCYPDHVASYMTSGLVLDMKQFIDSKETVTAKVKNKEVTVNVGYTQEELNDFVPSYLAEGKGSNFYDAAAYGFNDDSLLCIPFSKSTEVMYVNMDHLKQAGVDKVPTTWDEMWEATAKLKAANPGDGYYPLCYDSEANWVINMCMQNGWDYTTNADANHFKFNNQQVAAWFDQMTTKFNNKEILTKSTFSTEGSKYTSDLFKSNGCTFCIGSSAGAGYQDPGDLFKWAVAPIPGTKVGNEVNSSVISQGPSLVMFDQGDSERAKMTWLFIKDLIDPVNQASLSMATGYNPVRLSSFEIDDYKEFLAETSNIKAVTANVAKSLSPNFYTSAVFVGSSLARDQIGTAFVYAITEKKSASDALSDAYKSCGGK